MVKINAERGTNNEDTFRLLRHSVPVTSVIAGAEVGKASRCISPDHDDQNPSMVVYEDHVRCYSCEFWGDVVNVWGILHGLDKQMDAARDLARAFNIVLPDEAGPSANGSASKEEGCTLAAYAGYVGLPEEFLRDLRLKEIPYAKQRAVKMPYFDAAGTEEVCARFRVSLTGEPKVKTRKGDKHRLYGLWRLDGAREKGYVILVEGESDSQTGWYHDEPVIGIPGATGFQSEWVQDLDGIEKVYVVVEPDKGGERLWKSLAAEESLRDRLYRVQLDGAKDLRDLHRQDADNFGARLDGALERAAACADVPENEEEASQKRERADEAWNDCSDLAASTDLTRLFAEALKRSGVAGESNQIRLLYLSLNSRHLDKPVSVAVKGPSSGGKSHLVERVVAGFPESAVYELTSMSEKALIYLDEDMRHRFLVIYEASGMEGDMQTYLIRSLLSENRIRYQTAESTPKGVRPRLLEMEGPTGLLVTTTRNRMHPENETRLLSIYVTDTRDQTKEIFRALAEEDREEVSLEAWKSLQIWIEGGPCEVSVPFGKVLAEMVPPLATRLRRDFGAVLRLIKSHALLHRATRETDAKGRIVATLEDYAVVRELVEELVSEGVGGTVRDTIKETVQAVAALVAPEGVETVGVKKIADRLKLDRSTTQRRVKAAADEGFLVNEEDQRGKAARWCIGEPMPADVVVLPTREDLEEKYEGVQVCNPVGGETGGCPSEGCAGGVRCATHNAEETHGSRSEKAEKPVDTPNGESTDTREDDDNASRGRGGNGSAHLHTPTHDDENGDDAPHNAQRAHTPHEDTDPVRAFLADPPGWFVHRLTQFRETENEWYLDAARKIMALQVLGDAARHGEVDPLVRGYLEWLGEDVDSVGSDDAADADDPPHEPGADPLAAFLADPSPAFLDQARKYVQHERHPGLLKKLVTDCAFEVYGTAQRWKDTDGPVREWAATFGERA